MALETCVALGEAKIVPLIAAVRRPDPQKEEKEGSWPLPPPDMRETLEVFEGPLAGVVW